MVHAPVCEGHHNARERGKRNACIQIRIEHFFSSLQLYSRDEKTVQFSKKLDNFQDFSTSVHVIHVKPLPV